jgi:hypothetical protein
MKKGWLILAGSIFLGAGARAQTFTLQPTRLLPDTPAVYKLPVLPPPSSSRPVYPVSRLASDTYYSQCFGFFCKKEWNWQKRTGIPVKVRLGNYSYTQKLEGKQ